MKKVDTAKKRRIITWIVILIVLFILLTGLCLFIFSDMIRSCFSSANECCSVDSMEGIQKREKIKNMENVKVRHAGDFELNAKNMDSDDLENAMKEMESNR